MELRQLEIFVAVAKNLSFSKAAEEMYLSQSTVSLSIGSLEKDLKVQLFVRNTKEVSLTKSGVDLMAYAKKMLSLREQVIREISLEDREAKGTIDIISSTIPAQHLLPEIISSFQKQWPNVIFHVDQADSRQVERVMGSFRYDFGMIGTSPDDLRFIHHPIFDDDLVLAMPVDSTESTEMIQKNFADYITKTPFIMREPGSGTRSEIEILLLKLGIEPKDMRNVAYFADTHSILLAVSSGMGVSLVSKTATAMYTNSGLLRTIEMSNPFFKRQIHLLYNKESLLSPLQEAFVEHAKKYYYYNN